MKSPFQARQYKGSFGHVIYVEPAWPLTSDASFDRQYVGCSFSMKPEDARDLAAQLIACADAADAEAKEVES